MKGICRLLMVFGTPAIAAACMLNSSRPILPRELPKDRLDIIRRSQVWTPTNVASMNLRAGPASAGAFKAEQTVTCVYDEKERLSGGSPKFPCIINGTDSVKVKYGRENGEVYGEVAASRLLWALGFVSDAQYPVKVICRGCSEDPWEDRAKKTGETVFAVASIERKHPGTEIEPGDKAGWSWPELELIAEESGGAPRAHRDALKLLAVFLQHSDSKPVQQRVLCTDRTEPAKESECLRPMMMINDLGQTFGKANTLNRIAQSSTNLTAWSEVRVWRDPAQCVGELPKSATGTLEHPSISEEGRKFLADLLSQLTDQQLKDLFETARLSRRAVEVDGAKLTATTNAWIAAFKRKRAQIVDHRCPA